MPYDPDTEIGGALHRFPTTRQTLIDDAAGGGPAARDALAALTAVYWKPAYKHVRITWRRSNEESKDLVQGFFTTLLEQNLLARFDPEKGRLRTYLRACLDHYVQKQDESASRLKRGGSTQFAFDFDEADRELAASSPSPEDVFFREWQREIFSLALDDLRAYCEASGKQLQHRIFAAYDLGDEPRPSYADLAREHGIPVTSVTNHLAWARRELRRLALARLNGITTSGRESRDELRSLFGTRMSFLPDGALDRLRQLADSSPSQRYTIGPEIGRGGMGIVYQARDTELDRDVALKVVDALPEPIEEAKLLAQLEHPGLVPVYDAGTLADGRAFYAMRLVHGRRLDEFLAAEPLLFARLRVLEKACEAVAFAHHQGVVHCDLKPQNIMVGDFGEVFVMDWGAARRAGHTGARFGTPPYMAPEHEPLDARADLFSLGKLLEDIAASEPPAPLASIARKASAPAREDRYPDVPSFLADLNRFLDGLPVSAHRDSPLERAARFVRRNQVLLLLIASYLAVKLAIFFGPAKGSSYAAV